MSRAMTLVIGGGDDDEDESNSPTFTRVPFQKIGSAWSSYDNGSTGPDDPHWFATEKIHGAQLQLYVSRTRAAQEGATVVVRAAKRSGWIAPFDSFFGFQEVLRRNDAAAATLQRAVELCNVDDAEGGGFIVMYGEIFGGWYPTPAAAAKWKGAVASGRVTKEGKLVPSAGRAAVQEGVYYAPDTQFAVFDIAVVPSRGCEPRFLPFATVLDVCRQSGMMHVPVVGSGTEAAMQALSVDFDSLVPAMVSHHAAAGQDALPKLPPGTNLAEGLVLRPNGGAATVAYKGQPARPLMKRKNRAFAEVEAIERPNDDEPPAILVERVWRACLNHNRVAAAVSKLGANTTQLQLLDAVMDDIEADFWEVAPPQYQRAFTMASPDDLDVARSNLRRAALSLFNGARAVES